MRPVPSLPPSVTKCPGRLTEELSESEDTGQLFLPAPPSADPHGGQRPLRSSRRGRGAGAHTGPRAGSGARETHPERAASSRVPPARPPHALRCDPRGASGARSTRVSVHPARPPAVRSSLASANFHGSRPRSLPSLAKVPAPLPPSLPEDPAGEVAPRAHPARGELSATGYKRGRADTGGPGRASQGWGRERDGGSRGDAQLPPASLGTRDASPQKQECPSPPPAPREEL